MPFVDSATGYRLAARKRGAAAARQCLGVKVAGASGGGWWGGVSQAASKGIQAVGKASRFASKLTGTLPTGIGNVVSAGLGVVGEGIGNIMNARPGMLNKAKAAFGGAVSGLSGAIPGLGWVLPSMMTNGMNKAMGVKMACLTATQIAARAKLAAEGDNTSAPTDGGWRNWRNYLPLAGAAAGGLGAYAYMRHPEKAVAPYLQKMRDLARQGYTRPVHLGESPIYNLIKNTIKVDKAAKTYEMPWYSRALFRAVHGDGAVPIISDITQTTPKYYPKGFKSQRPAGLVMDDRFVNGPHNGAIYPTGRHDRWAHEGSREAHALIKNLESNKGKELRYLLKHAPGSSPDHVDVSSMLARTRGSPEQRIRQFQAALEKVRAERGYDDIVLKPVKGFQSDGKFPRSTKLTEQWAAYNKALKNKALRAQYDQHILDNVDGDPGHLVKFLKDHDLYEGHALHNALKNPKTLMGQQFVPGHIGELRVHVINGQVMPWGTGPRGWYKQGRGDSLKQMAHVRGAHQLAQETIDKLPEAARTGSYGIDMATFKHPVTGEISHKIMELNPAHHGAQSGFLSAGTLPYGEHALERHLTGRWAKPVAAAGGMLGAAGGGALGVAAKRLTAPKEEPNPSVPA